MLYFCFFFFKHKTAYEMRISDWSSDVCSSDLALLQIARDDDGAYWLGSQRGLWRVQPGQIPVPVPLGGPGIVKPMTTLLRTDDGALWVPVEIGRAHV